MKDKIILGLLGGLLIYCITLTVYLLDVEAKAERANNTSWYLYQEDYIRLRLKAGEITMSEAVEETRRNSENYRTGLYR